MTPTQPVHDFDCAVCGKQIEKPGDGLLAARDDDATAAEFACEDREYERRHVVTADGLPEVCSLTSLLAEPDIGPVPWQAFHYKCRDGRFRYEIELERITQWWQVADWTAHLLETRSWLRYTDWYALLRHFAGLGAEESPA